MSDQLGKDTGPGSTGARAAADIAWVMFTAFVVAVVLLHFLRPDMPPLQTFMSDYATGAYGFLMTAAFLAWASGLIALMVAISGGIPPSFRSRVGLVLLGISSFAMVLVAIYPGDLAGANPTTAGAVHNLASLLFFFALMIAMLLISIRLRRAGQSTGGYAALFWLAIAAVPMFVAAFAFFDAAGLVGLGQRIYVMVLLSWLTLLAVGIRNRSFAGV